MNFREATLKGCLEAKRTHKQLGIGPESSRGVAIDVFRAIEKGFQLPLLFRPMDHLLGALLKEPHAGVLVTTNRPLSVQRFTAAHELGHYRLQHQGECVDTQETMEEENNSGKAQEIEANAFASEFLSPTWLIRKHISLQGWEQSDLCNHQNVYQLSLRLGVSYQAMCVSLCNNRFISTDAKVGLLAQTPSEIKRRILGKYKPEKLAGDVWVLTENDAELKILAGPSDILVIRLSQASSAGFSWDMKPLHNLGYAIQGDHIEIPAADLIGGEVTRQVVAQGSRQIIDEIAIVETRPWSKSEVRSRLAVEVDSFGKEEGVSRDRRRIIRKHGSDN